MRCIGAVIVCDNYNLAAPLLEERKDLLQDGFWWN